MKVRGDLQPSAAFTVEAMPQRPGWCMVRFFENAVPREEHGWEYDEYHLELPNTGNLAADIEGNFDVYIQQAKVQDAAIPQQQMEGAVKDLQQNLQSVSAVSSIAFVLMAEAGQIDDVTAGEHADVFGVWAYPVAYKTGNIRRYEGKLYRCLQDHISQAGWEPAAAASLWTEICESHAGTADDPIPYWGNMALEAGKYYSQDSAVYRCTRNTEIPVYHDLADLVGLYVEKA